MSVPIKPSGVPARAPESSARGVEHPTPDADEPDPAPDAPQTSSASGQVHIGVSSGDFSTPARRTRRITRPRGLKAVSAVPAETDGVARRGGAGDRAAAASPETGVDLAAISADGGAESDGLGVIAPPEEPASTLPPGPASEPLSQARPRKGASAVDEFLSSPPTPVPLLELTPDPTPAPGNGPGARADAPREPAMELAEPVVEPPIGPELIGGENSPPAPEAEPEWQDSVFPAPTTPAGLARAATALQGTDGLDLNLEVPIVEAAMISAPDAGAPEAGPIADRDSVRGAPSTGSTGASRPGWERLGFEPPPTGRGPSTATTAARFAAPFFAESGSALPEPSHRDDDHAGEITALSPLALTLAHMAEALHAEGSYEVPQDEIELLEAPLVMLEKEGGKPNNTPPPVPRHAKAIPGAATAGIASVAGIAPMLAPPPATTTAPSPPSLLPVPMSAPLPPEVPEALAERPRRTKRSKPWYEEIFDENYLRTLPFMTAEQTLREADFIQASLNPTAGARLLDVGCGYGRHAMELVQRGLSVTGLDLSLPLLMRAAEESQRRSLAVDFVHGDMRQMEFERQFDGAYCMLTTFGYFDEESNLTVAEGIARALKPGARLLVDVVNRDYIVGDLPARIWWEGEGCVVLEEVEHNFNTNRLLTRRSVVFDDGRQLDQEISLRTYCLHDLGKLLRQAGFRVVEVSGSIFTKGRFFGATSRNLLVTAERRSDGA